MADYKASLFEPALNYKIDFDLKKKAAEHIMAVVYNKVIEREGKNSIQKILEHKEIVQKISGYQYEKTTVYWQGMQDQNKGYIDVKHTKVERITKDLISWTKERIE